MTLQPFINIHPDGLQNPKIKIYRTRPSGASCPIGNSFTPETKVLMADGSTKPIEDVKVGDKVTTTDPDTGKTTEREVVATIIGDGQKNLIQVTVTLPATSNADPAKDSDDKTGTVIATNGHPFWVQDLHAWTNAADLQPGMWLRTSAGTYVQIKAVTAWTQTSRVHNLTVTQDHTYYVEAGDTPVLVHNCTTTVYRRQAHPGSERLSVDAGGNVGHQGSGTLYVNMSGNSAHSGSFRGGAGEIVAFDMPTSYVDSILEAALPQRQPRSGPLSELTRKAWRHRRSTSPEISDPHQSPGLIGIPDNMIDDFMANIIPGSGRTS